MCRRSENRKGYEINKDDGLQLGTKATVVAAEKNLNHFLLRYRSN